MKILIATGIYPPDIGGPAQYSKNLEEVLKKQGHEVDVKFFRFENKLPTGVRHLYYFLRILPAVFRAEVIFAFDTFSVAFPALLAAKLFGKKIIVRTGGDFLWESYVERTGDLVLLKNFYQTSQSKFSTKENIIFSITRMVLQKSSAVIFSTSWQKEIFTQAYDLVLAKLFIVENYYGTKQLSVSPEKKNFIAGTRPLKWKNDIRLLRAFTQVSEKDETVEYDNSTKPFATFMEVLAGAYAVILVSLGDVSPNLILDAIRYNKPFILTKETGLYERVRDCAIFVDPENVADIAEKIHWLSDAGNYELQKRKVEAFTFVHTWEDIGREFLEVYKKIS